MKALTLQQPFALVGVLGIKPWETRPRPTKFRGRHLITTSANWTAEYRKYADQEVFRKASLGNEYYLGGIIGSAEITDCVSTLDAVKLMAKDVSDGKMEKWEMERAMYFGNFEAGRFAYKWERAVQFEKPIACKGALGIYNTAKIAGNFQIVECIKTVQGQLGVDGYQVLYLGQELALWSEDKNVCKEIVKNIMHVGIYDSLISHYEKFMFKL